MCSTEQVQKDAGFSRVTSYSYPHSTWLKTGEKAQGFCSVDILRVEHYTITCNDGNWLPKNVVCPEDLRTHYP
ncbi:unnamed protein product [Heligmosomoides polygyrus]|uniref:Sushi domain-containing protein n=1 Tax=Heligmosomoides polygyrus TaxID=6339 RepID=A0A183G6W8_HELPZ|nr:unnamed protein product [Heligmosomoides polygyrus]